MAERQRSVVSRRPASAPAPRPESGTYDSDTPGESVADGRNSSKPEDLLQALQNLRQTTRNRTGKDNEVLHRLRATESVVGLMRTCSSEVVETSLNEIDDMVALEADIESQKTAVELLGALAANPESTDNHARILRMLIVPLSCNLAYPQMVALDAVLKQQIPSAESYQLILRFLNRIIEDLFHPAERARQSRHEEVVQSAHRDSITDQERPYEEKALLKALSLIIDLIRSRSPFLELRQVDSLLTIVTKYASQTTSVGLMRGFFQAMSACTSYFTVSRANTEACVRIVCAIACDERYGFTDEVTNVLSALLRSDPRRTTLEILFDEILAESSQTERARGSVLRLIACTYKELDEQSEAGVLDEYIRTYSESCSAEHELPLSLLESLMDLTLACGCNVDEYTFGNLIVILSRLANLTSKGSAATRPVSSHLADGLIRLFLRCYMVSGSKAIMVYDLLVRIAAIGDPTSVRLSVMELLMRLRCDADYRIKLISVPDSLNLAAALCRTKATAATVRESASPSSNNSANDCAPPTRRGHSQASDMADRARSQSNPRSKGVKDRFPSAKESLWVYDETRKGLPVDPFTGTSRAVFVLDSRITATDAASLDLGAWLKVMILELEAANHWELYTYILVHMPSQLSNCSLFYNQPRWISHLHELLTDQLSNDKFCEPPQNSGIRRGDVALCLYHSLIMLLAYQDCIGLRQWNRTVSTFRTGIERWDRAGKLCIHALSMCCYEIPNIIENQLTIIVEMMQKRITQSNLAMDILEFLGGLAKLPDAYDRSDVALHQKIFGICIRYLQHAREERRMDSVTNSAAAKTSSNRVSGSSGDGFRMSRQRQAGQSQMNLHEYVFTIAYQVMIFWFLAIDVRERARHVAWITRELTWKTENGREEMEQQSMVFLDFMHRTTFSNLGETHSAPQFNDASRKVHRETWLVGLSIVTAEVVVDAVTERPECGQFIKRQASGTTHAVYYHNTEEKPNHQIANGEALANSGHDLFNIYPNHMILQLISTISPVPAPLQPIPLPGIDDITRRTLRQFDATPTIDNHKAAVIYIAEGQTKEHEILANTGGSMAFEAFLSHLGYRICLKDAKFNTQGLDRHDNTDGTHTYAWRDRVAEIVFHVPTMMPNNTVHDSSFARKKSHIGNDHVKIVFNDSGQVYKTNIFPSDFNSVNIIVTPEAHSRSPICADAKEPVKELASSEHEASATGYYLVQTVTSEQYPDFSPASSIKIISASGLPSFIRQVAITASVFCQVWPRNLSEYTSSWRFRLQQILKLRERFANANASANVDYPEPTDITPASFAEGGPWSGVVAYGGLSEVNSLISNLDFTRWTR